MMKTKLLKTTAVTMTLILALGLSACTSGNSKDSGKDSSSGKTAQTESDSKNNPDSKEEAAKLYQKLMQKENDILAANSKLWEKVFLAANKNNPMIEDGTNYGDFLLKTIDGAKDQFSKDELKTLKEGAEEIKKIEGRLTVLEQKYPDCGTKPGSGDSVDASEAGMSTSDNKDDKGTEKSSAISFPGFKGKDLDGNAVDSKKLFAKNKVTVVNFWFTTCNPCVGELKDLQALNKKLQKKGGEVIGVNTFTIDGDKAAIKEAKDILSKKKITYKNVWFATNSEAGKFTSGLFSYPTTYVVDQKGNIVGEPIVGAITAKDQAKRLNELIDQAIENGK